MRQSILFFDIDGTLLSDKTGKIPDSALQHRNSRLLPMSSRKLGETLSKSSQRKVLRRRNRMRSRTAPQYASSSKPGKKFFRRILTRP